MVVIAMLTPYESPPLKCENCGQIVDMSDYIEQITRIRRSRWVLVKAWCDKTCLEEWKKTHARN